MPYPTLAPNSSWYKGTTPRASITEINIVDSYSGSETEVWNADVDNSGSIKCYVSGTVLTMAGNGTGKIYANPDSSWAFSDINKKDYFVSLIRINGTELLDTGKVTTMYAMFCQKYKGGAVTKLESHGDISGWDTSKVTNFANMFQDCALIETLDLGKWDLSSATTLMSMFYGCLKLTDIGDTNNWNVSKVTDIQTMFCDCPSFEHIKADNWDVSNVTDMTAIFQYCYALKELNLSSWDTSKCIYPRYMFNQCTALTKIFVSEKWNVKNATNSTNMFNGASSLVGGAGTKYDKSKTNAAYAVIDNGDSAPGYLTYLGGGLLTIPHDLWMIGDAIRRLKGETAHYSLPEMVAVLREYPVLAAQKSWYRSSYDPAAITAINVVPNYTSTGTEDEGWFADEAMTGSILCYRTGSTLTLTPVEKNRIRMNADSSRMFSEMPALVTISGLDYLDASGVETFEEACYKDVSLTEFLAPTWRNGKISNSKAAFKNCIALSRADLGRGLTIIGDGMFFNCSSLQNISGIQNVKAIDDLAFYVTPDLTTTDMKAERLARIGQSTFRLSSIEDGLDLSSMKLSSVGDYATRLKRWGTDGLAAIKNVTYPNTSVYIEVPNPDSQLNYPDVPYGHDSDGNEYSVADYGCVALTLYHLWNAVYAGTERQYDNWLDWWNATLNSDGAFAANNNIESNTAIGARFSRLGWTLTSTPRVSSADQLVTILSMLESGNPVYAVINNTADDIHAIAIIGYDAENHKLAVLDSGLYGHENGLVYWVSFEDLFVGGSDEPDRLHIINYHPNGSTN